MLHRHVRPAVAVAYLSGAICGAALTATGLLVLSGLVSPVPASWRATTAVACLVLLAAQTAGLICLDLPQRKWQIPQEMFHRRPTDAAWRFAAILGTGVRTFITSPSVYALAVVMVLTPPAGLGASIIAAALAAVGFGIGRSVIVVAQAALRSAAVSHDQRWLTAAGCISIAACLVVALRVLTAA